MSQSLPQSNEVADWYDHRYATGLEQAFGRPPIESKDRLERLELQDTGLKILDVGAGQGYFVREANLQGHHGIGIDISFEGARIARSVAESDSFIVSDGQILPFVDNIFDVVTFWGTLEHHQDMVLALQECKRVIKPGGRVAIRVPNRDFWLYKLAAVFGLQTGTEQQEIVEHLLSQDEWQSLFEQQEFEISRLRADNWFVRSTIGDTPGLLPKMKMLLRKISIAIAPLRYTYVFDFECKVRE